MSCPVAGLRGSNGCSARSHWAISPHDPLVLSADRSLAEGRHDMAAELVGKPRRDRAAGHPENARSGVHLKRINLVIGSWI